MKIHAILLLALLAAACGGQNKSAEAAQITDPFEPVEVPEAHSGVDMMGVDRGRVWLAQHYWDNAHLADTAWLSRKEQLTTRTIGFVEVLMGVDKPTADAAMRTYLEKSAEGSREQLQLTAEVLDDLLYDPNSPLRSEGLYVGVLEYLVASPLLDEAEKERPRYQLVMAVKNNPGDPATDFVYTLPDDSQRRLSQITAPLVLLYFYNPDCTGCKEMTEALKANQLIAQAVQMGEMEVLALFPDTTLTLWRDHFPEMNPHWIVSYDRGEVIRKNQLYDLKAIPTLYLLGPEQLVDPSKPLDVTKKYVLLKDATAEQLDWYLNNLAQQQQAQQY